jgi:uncharacterized heparinase superfamily protein
VQRATAAHSTLTIDDTNSSVILDQAGAIAGSVGARPDAIAAVQQEAEGNQWLDASHDGYARRFRVIHHRRLFLAASGEDLRGEDRLSASGSANAVKSGRVAIRFHLHPQVRAELAADAGSVLLILGEGQSWRFRAAGGTLALADSVYMGRVGEMQRTQQIVVSATVKPDLMVKWAFRREG